MTRHLSHCLLLVPIAGLLVAGLAATAGAKGGLPKVRRSAEFKYIDEPDEVEADKRLVKLLKKYDTPKKCVGLLKALRKRSYPSKVPSRITLKHLCTDGKTREFTILAPVHRLPSIRDKIH